MGNNHLYTTNNTDQQIVIGEVDLSAAAAVGAIRGSGLLITKTGVGTYVVRLSSRFSGCPLFYEMLNRQVSIHGAAPAGALGAKIVTVATDTVADYHKDILFTINTTAGAGGSGAVADTTAAITLSFYLVFRTRSPR